MPSSRKTYSVHMWHGSWGIYFSGSNALGGKAVGSICFHYCNASVILFFACYFFKIIIVGLLELKISAFWRPQ